MIPSTAFCPMRGRGSLGLLGQIASYLKIQFQEEKRFYLGTAWVRLIFIKSALLYVFGGGILDLAIARH